MVYEIKKFGSEVLREKCEKITEINDEIKEILSNMVETMIAANGVGLAAPQVGFNKRMIVCMLGENLIKKMVDPVVTPMGDELIEFEEGCLSVPGIYKNVNRYRVIKVNYLDEEGKACEEILEDFRAVVVQHETDHLDGVLFVDKISPVAKRMVSKKLRLLKKATLKHEEKQDEEK